MEKSNNAFVQAPLKQNKGFNVWVGNDYIGTLVIQEKRKTPEMVEKLADPANMQKLMKVAELRPFEPNKVDDTTDILGILDGSVEESDAVPEESEEESKDSAQA